MKTITLIIIGCIVLLFSAKAGMIGVEPTNGNIGDVSGGGGLNLGWEFQVTATNGIVVDGLGFWDYQSDGFSFGQTFTVGLWDSASRSLLRNSILTYWSPLKPALLTDGGWRINPIAPVFLAPGHYRIGALMPEAAANPIVYSGATYQSGTGVSVVRFLRELGIPTLAMPDLPLNFPDDVCFGPTFTYTLGTGVPVQGSVVAPSNYTATAGNTGANTLVRNNGFPRAYQMQFSPAVLGGLPVGARITELRFRLAAAAVASFPTNTVTWPEYWITLAGAAHSIPSMSTNFTSNLLSPVSVKTEPLLIGTSSFVTNSGSNPFGLFCVFDTPYTYQGGDLVMLFRHLGSDASYSAFFDALTTSSPGYGTNFRAFSANSFSATGGSQVPLIIPQIVFTYPLRESIIRNGSNVIISGTGASLGGTYRLIASTNIALPMSQWTAIATNQCGSTGSFHHTNAIDTSLPAQLFRIALP